jgi:ABC-type iron transport system FetAB ATPase subunit
MILMVPFKGPASEGGYVPGQLLPRWWRTPALDVDACGVALTPTPLPQVGTLRDQVAYPQRLGFDRTHDTRIQECLDAAGMGKLAAASTGGLDLLHDEWDDVLSGGERQRIGAFRKLSE